MKRCCEIERVHSYVIGYYNAAHALIRNLSYMGIEDRLLINSEKAKHLKIILESQSQQFQMMLKEIDQMIAVIHSNEEII